MASDAMSKSGRQTKSEATIVASAAPKVGDQRFAQMRYMGSIKMESTAAQSIGARKGVTIARASRTRATVAVINATLGKV